jgi:hypothetical protein
VGTISGDGLTIEDRATRIAAPRQGPAWRPGAQARCRRRGPRLR